MDSSATGQQPPASTEAKAGYFSIGDFVFMVLTLLVAVLIIQLGVATWLDERDTEAVITMAAVMALSLF